jgi:hypothetical protein
MSTATYLDAFHPYTQQHDSGVHINCKPKGRYGGDSVNSCKYAGYGERWHAHDYEGLLVCGCVEFSTAEGI